MTGMHSGPDIWVNVNGEFLPLNELAWILRRSCGCVAGTQQASALIAGAEQAWRCFFTTKRPGREVEYAQRVCDLALEPMPESGLQVYPLTEPCPHGRYRRPNTTVQLGAGDRYERLTVVSDRRRGVKTVQCVCDCGTEVSVPVNAWGRTRSCGCYRSEITSARSTRHGMARTPIYLIWAEMVARCTRRTHKRFAGYGGRGITVCERWMSFENFYNDMGDRPSGRSLDRTDNDAGYSPENCRWATASEQAKNRRRHGWEDRDRELNGQFSAGGVR